MMQTQQSLTHLYDHLWSVHGGGRFAVLDDSLHPRGPSFLFDLTDPLGLDASATILDLGCGQGNYTVELAARYGSHVVAIDPLERHLQQAEHLVSEAGLGGQVTVHAGSMEAIPVTDETIELIWCRGVLVHVSNLRAAFNECRRVLRPRHHMLLFTAFATDLLEPREAQRLYEAMSIHADSMRRDHVERLLVETGFDIVRSEMLGSEFAENTELQDGRCSRDLLRLARLLRQPDRFRSELGPEAYHSALGLYHWVVYQLLGKLSFHVFLLQKSS